jgi:hypothetical protein
MSQPVCGWPRTINNRKNAREQGFQANFPWALIQPIPG